MHALAEALRTAGVTAYVLDIRGHGGSGRRGDIDYIGQIDDDPRTLSVNWDRQRPAIATWGADRAASAKHCPKKCRKLPVR